MFILPHGFQASGEDSTLDGVYLEAQLQSLGVDACQNLLGGGGLSPGLPTEFSLILITRLLRV